MKKIDNEELKKLYLGGKNTVELAEIYGCSHSTIGDRLKKLGIKLQRIFPKLEIGQTFSDGNLLIVDLGNGMPDKSGSIRQTYIVECQKCGNRSEIRRAHLVSKNRKCCKHCMEKGTQNARWKGYGELSASKFYQYQFGAKSRELEFNITIEDVWGLYEKQRGQCALSGEEIKFNPEKGWVKRDITASLDRIDSTKGYVLENLQWISKDIQFMKNDKKETDFIDWCKKISDYQNELINYSNLGALQEWKHHKNWGGHGNISKKVYTKYKLEAEQRKLSWNVSIEELWNLFIKQGGLCVLSGLPINFSKKWQRTAEQTASLDRIDSIKGYEIDNLQWLYSDVNMMKWKLAQDRFIELCHKITQVARPLNTLNS